MVAGPKGHLLIVFSALAVLAISYAECLARAGILFSISGKVRGMRVCL